MQTRASLYVYPELLARNIADLKILAPGKEIIPMVKSNGYGHGAVEISNTLMDLEINILGVASLAEALELRTQMDKSVCEIYVFSDPQLSDAENLSLYQDFRLTPVISNQSDLNIFLKAKEFAGTPLILKFNTGMNRLGLAPQDLELICGLIKKSGRKSIDHVMTHFACASQSIELAHNTRQQDEFANIICELKKSGLSVHATSIANSGALEQKTGLEYSHIRPGLMMYGPSSLIPGIKSQWNGRIISSLKVRILETRQMKKGDPIGYGLTPISKDGKALIASIGYGDGFNNRYQKSKFQISDSNQTKHDVQVVGRVNMDMVQLLAAPECSIKAGELVSFWDDDPHSIDQICSTSKSIPYELFCQLSVRVPRIFKLP
ncbi:MAG: alanine racemase [Halobacteriovorax sp.]|nr:alanine racemase [Halobacteriovorax sp.]